MVGQAALHDVRAVAGAGFDGGQAATVGAVNQLHQGLPALWTQRHLRRFDKTVSISILTQAQGEGLYQETLTTRDSLDVIVVVCRFIVAV